MNKNGIIIGVIVLLLLFGGAVFLLGKNQATTSPDALQTQPKNAGGSVITSIKDALTKSMTLQCSFTDGTGRNTTSYVKNGAIRTDYEASDPQQSGSMIIKDQKMYFWNGQQGFMTELPDEAKSGQPPQGGQQNDQVSQGQDMLKTLEQYKENCKPGVVADSLFTPPADVKFSDFSSLIKIPPTGVNGNPQGYDQKQVEEYMKQYAPNEASGDDQ